MTERTRPFVDPIGEDPIRPSVVFEEMVGTAQRAEIVGIGGTILGPWRSDDAWPHRCHAEERSCRPLTETLGTKDRASSVPHPTLHTTRRCVQRRLAVLLCCAASEHPYAKRDDAHDAYNNPQQPDVQGLRHDRGAE